MMRAFKGDGFAVLPSLVTEAELASIEAAMTQHGSVGSRDLLAEPWCTGLAHRLLGDVRLSDAIPRSYVPVQCTSFEKSLELNWLVAVHQDLAIPVAARIDHPALSGWSNKGGTWFVQPGVSVLEQLVAVRLHIDNCGIDDGPLTVVAGSHREGRLNEAQAIELRNARAACPCPVPRGGAMLMRPLLLHASSKATGSGRRRVLHFVFGPPHLPCGLSWARPRAA